MLQSQQSDLCLRVALRFLFRQLSISARNKRYLMTTELIKEQTKRWWVIVSGSESDDEKWKEKDDDSALAWAHASAPLSLPSFALMLSKAPWLKKGNKRKRNSLVKDELLRGQDRPHILHRNLGLHQISHNPPNLRVTKPLYCIPNNALKVWKFLQFHAIHLFSCFKFFTHLDCSSLHFMQFRL